MTTKPEDRGLRPGDRVRAKRLDPGDADGEDLEGILTIHRVEGHRLDTYRRMPTQTHYLVDGQPADPATIEREESAMTPVMQTVIVPVGDIAAAKQLYSTLLGVAPSMDEVYYVGFNVEGQHIGLDPNGHAKGMTGPVGYWHVGDIAKTVESLVAAGAEVVQAATDVGAGRLVATLRDADGNPIGLLQDPTSGWS